MLEIPVTMTACLLYYVCLLIDFVHGVPQRLNQKADDGLWPWTVYRNGSRQTSDSASRISDTDYLKNIGQTGPSLTWLLLFAEL